MDAVSKLGLCRAVRDQVGERPTVVKDWAPPGIGSVACLVLLENQIKFQF
jgi:hypothetical protein